MVTKAHRAASPGSGETPAGPPIDLVREGDWLVLRISLPGVRATDFQLSLVGDQQVYITGTVQYCYPVPRESLALAERPYGPFSRSINLPFPVGTHGATVQFERGVLTVRLPLRIQRLALHWLETEGYGGAKPR